MLTGAIGIYEYQHFILNLFLKCGCCYLWLSWNLMVWESVWNLDRKESLYVDIWAVDLFYKLKALFVGDMDPEIREWISTFWVLMPYLAISHNLRKKIITINIRIPDRKTTLANRVPIFYTLFYTHSYIIIYLQ